jgi:hypothetical protein
MNRRQKSESPEAAGLSAPKRKLNFDERAEYHAPRNSTQLLRSTVQRTKPAMPLVARSQTRVADLRRIARGVVGLAAEMQHRRLLRAFRSGPLTVVDARLLDVMSFHARLIELQDAGYRFTRRWVLQSTDTGRTHKVVEVALVRSKEVAGK